MFEFENGTLETPRLRLRYFEKTDLSDLYEYARVEGVGEMAGWMHHKSIEESEIVLDMLMKSKSSYAIVLKSEKKVIGSIGFSDSKEGVEIGYVLSKAYHNRGLMTECVQAVLSYCFDELGMDEIYYAYYKDNEISKRINKKFGFTFVKREVVETLGLGKKERVLTVFKNPASLELSQKKEAKVKEIKESKEEIKDEISRILKEVDTDKNEKNIEGYSLLDEPVLSDKSDREIEEKIRELKSVNSFKKVEFNEELLMGLADKTSNDLSFSEKRGKSKLKLKRLNKYNKLAIKELYTRAFPKEERIDFSYLSLKARTRRADFVAIYDEDEYIGLAYLIYYKKIVFLFFLAVEERYRGRGYGTRILARLKEAFKNRAIVLWVETTKENHEGEFENLDERKRRKNFYFKSGYVESPYGISEKGVRYDVLEIGDRCIKEDEMHDLLRQFFGKPLYYLYYVLM